MRQALRSALLLTVLSLPALPAAAAAADTMVAPELRIGSHPGFGRVVFDFPHFVDYRMSREGDRVLLRFAEPTVISDPGVLPRNVTAIVAHDGVVEVDFVHGAQPRPVRMGNRVVLDVVDPATRAEAAAKPAARPAPARGAAEAAAATPVNPAQMASGRQVAAPAAPVEANKPPEKAAPPAAAQAEAPRPAAEPPQRASAAATPAAEPAPPAAKPAEKPAPAPLPTIIRPTATESAKPAEAPHETAIAKPAEAPHEKAARPAEPAREAAPAKSVEAPQPAPRVLPAAPVRTAQLPASPVASTPEAAPAAAGSPAERPPAGTMQLAARLVALPAGTPGSAAFLPLGQDTGGAAFQRGNTGIAVFDGRAPLDLAGLRDDPVLGKAAIQLLPAATLFTVKLPPGSELRLARVAGGWVVTASPAVAAPRQIAPVPDGTSLKFPAEAASQVIVVPDPETGRNLLVGTQKKPGQGIGVARRAPQFTLDPSWQGVVVDPISDNVTLRSEPEGFVLASDGKSLDLSADPASVQAAADAARFTRRYDFPDLPAAALLRRMQEQVQAAAAAPALARAAPRRDAAEAMVALGMGAEAQSLIQLATQDDPHAATPDLAGLGAIAALLAGRTAESAALDDPALTGTDEIALWRAVRNARLHEGAPDAAATFANTLPLILSYPPALRSRVLPLAAETMALGGAAPAAQKLVASRSDDPTLAYARALLLAGKGDVDGALAGFDALAQGRDQYESARAAEQGVELRLKSGKIGPAQAADALGKQFYAWRGDDREARLRLRVVDLRTQAGQFRPALALLRETAAGWPDQKDAMRARMGDVFGALLKQDDPKAISPLDLVTLAGDNADVLPQGPDGEKLAGLLADKLAALDLPRRAAPVLQKLMQASSGPARAAYGARLAEVQLRDGDAVAASQALADSQMDGLAQDLVLRRTLLQARILARQGKPADAVTLLSSLDDPAADELRADIAESAKDWGGAETALRTLITRRVPGSGDLDNTQQSLLLRYASAASQAGDAATLKTLRDRETKRMQQGKLGNMFRLLTADSVKTVADLPRVAAETSLLRGIPGGLQAMRAP